MKGALPRKPSEILTPDRTAISLRALTPDRMALDGHVDWWQEVIVYNLQKVRDALFRIRPLLQWSLCECCRRCRVASRLIRKCYNQSWTGWLQSPALLRQTVYQVKTDSRPCPLHVDTSSKRRMAMRSNATTFSCRFVKSNFDS